jgi:hypothetical protein
VRASFILRCSFVIDPSSGVRKKQFTAAELRGQGKCHYSRYQPVLQQRGKHVNVDDFRQQLCRAEA